MIFEHTFSLVTA